MAAAIQADADHETVQCIALSGTVIEHGMPVVLPSGARILAEDKAIVRSETMAHVALEHRVRILSKVVCLAALNATNLLAALEHDLVAAAGPQWAKPHDSVCGVVGACVKVDGQLGGCWCWYG